MTDHHLADADADDDDAGQLAGVAVSRVAAVIEHAELVSFLKKTKWSARSDVASAWQPSRMYAQWQELRASAAGLDRDRVYEIHVLMASIGERFSLAIAAGNEVEIWNEVRKEKPGTTRSEQAAQEMQHRAMAELQSYYLLGTGHSLASIVMRVIALESGLRPRLLDRMGASCTVGSDRVADWPSLTVETCRDLRKVARESRHVAIQRLPEAITTIVQSNSWQELDQIRGEEYHRNRPPSAPVDAPFGRAWQRSGDGHVLAIGGPTTTPNDRAAHLAALLRQGERLMLSEMPTLRTQIDEVFTALMPPRRAP